MLAYYLVLEKKIRIWLRILIHPMLLLNEQKQDYEVQQIN